MPMQLIRGLHNLKKQSSCVLTIGNFDGVHQGHQKVFSATKKFSKKRKIKFGVLTFTPLPVMFFKKKIKNFRLSSESEKIKLLKTVTNNENYKF